MKELDIDALCHLFDGKTAKPIPSGYLTNNSDNYHWDVLLNKTNIEGIIFIHLKGNLGEDIAIPITEIFRIVGNTENEYTEVYCKGAENPFYVKETTEEICKILNGIHNCYVKNL